MYTHSTGEWRKLHNRKLTDLGFSPNINWVMKLRRMRWAGHFAHMGERRGVYRVLVGKPKGKRVLARPRHGCYGGSLVSGVGGMDWIDRAQDMDRWWTLVNTVMNLRVP